MRGTKFIPENIDLNVMGWRKVSFAVTALVIVLSLLLVFQRGLNFGVDFSGGAVIEIRTPEPASVDILRTELNKLDIGPVSVRALGAAQDEFLIRIRHRGAQGAESDKAAIETVRIYLDAQYEGEEGESLVDYRRAEFVTPQLSADMKTKSMYAVLLALLGILAYIWIRFEWQFGVAAVVALGFDVTATLGLFALTQMEFNLTSIAAVLLIAGYSINDTVIVFDRIRELLRKYTHMPIFEILNLSVNQTLTRTMMTTLSTALALAGLYIFGGELVREFAYALVFGIVVGVYSSVYVAAPVLALTGIKRDVLRANDDVVAPLEDGAA